MTDKLDKKWVGIILGLIIPAFCFFCYWLFVYSQLSFPYGFIRYLRKGDMLQEVTIACVVMNLLVFYLFLNKKKRLQGYNEQMLYFYFIFQITKSYNQVTFNLHRL